MISIDYLHIQTPTSPARQLLHVEDLQIAAGSLYAIIGGSGNGKSLFVQSLLGMKLSDVKVTQQIRLPLSTDTASAKTNKWEAFRREHCFTVLQDAMNSFNPSLPLGRQLHRLCHRRYKVPYAVFAKYFKPYLHRLRLTPDVLSAYPVELSGGMLQRCMVAAAIYVKPAILIADEPTSNIDKESQAIILEEIKRLHANEKTTVVLVCHDIDLVRQLEGHVFVFENGLMIEEGPAKELLASPKNPYTKRLIQASLLTRRGDDDDTFGNGKSKLCLQKKEP